MLYFLWNIFLKNEKEKRKNMERAVSRSFEARGKSAVHGRRHVPRETALTRQDHESWTPGNGGETSLKEELRLAKRLWELVEFFIPFSVVLFLDVLHAEGDKFISN